MNTALYAIICTWNEEDIIASTVRHAFAQGCDKVFVVDNGSTDATQEGCAALTARFPGRVRVHRNPRNLGFARAKRLQEQLMEVS